MIAASLPLVAGCEKSASEAQRDSIAAKQHAEEKVARETKEAQEKIAAANQQADDKIHNTLGNAGEKIANAEGKRVEETAEARQEAERDTLGARAHASDKIAEAQDTLDKRRAELRHDFDKRAADVDKKLADARAKIVSTTKTTKADAQVGLKRAETRVEELKRELKTIDTAAPASLDTFKKTTEQKFDELEKMLRDVADKI